MMIIATIEEKSKVVAGFMGAELDITCAHYDECDVDPTKGTNNPGYRRYDQMEYHSSFEWLMPVIRKCRDINKKSEKGLFNDPTNNLRAQVMYERVEAHLLDLHVLSTFNAVFQMIDWYNKTIRDEYKAN